MKIKDKILSETSEEVKQRVRDTANKLVMKEETVEEAATKLLWKKYPYHPPLDSGYWQDMFIAGAKWQQETTLKEHNYLQGFINQFEEEGEYQELSNNDLTVSSFLEWMKLNNFKIIKI